jgi:predicted RND superfamily exporter protein
MFERIVALAVRKRLAIALAIALVSAAFGLAASRLGVDNSLEVWFVEDDPALASYQDFLEEFGSDEVVVVAIRFAGDPFDPGRLRRLERLTARIGAIDGVARVHSLTSLGPSENARTAVARGGLASHFVGRDEDSLLLIAEMDATASIDVERPRILEEIRDATRAETVPDEQTHFGGVGVLHDALNRVTIGEGGLFIGLSYGVIAVALVMITRRLTWTLIALLVVTLADIALIGTMALLGRPINMITVAVPPVVMILGVANVIHMSTDLDLARARGVDSVPGLRATLYRVAVPCGFNALTTGVAFLSLTAANMAVTRDYGLFAAVGVGFAFLYSLLLMAAVLPRVPSLPRPSSTPSRLSRVTEACMLTSLRRPRAALVVTALVLAVSIAGAGKIVVDTYSIGFLPDDDPVRRDDRIIEASVGPYLPMELTLRSTASDWRAPEFLDAVQAAQRAVESDPQIGRTTTVVDVLREANFVLSGTAAPGTGDAPNAVQLAGAERMLRMAGHSDLFDRLVADDQRTVRLTATTPGMSVQNFVVTAERVRDAAQDAAGTRAEVRVSGYLPLYAQIIEHVVEDQVRSFSVAFLLVFLVVSVALRSWRFALVAIPPNLLPVCILLGVMGFAGINLNIATVTVAAVVLGVIVDDTVHLLHRLRRELSIEHDLETAMRNVARASGLAVVCTSMVFAAGFLTISLAASDAVADAGLLMAVAVVAALLTDLLLLPAFIGLLFGRARAARQGV